MLIRENVVEVLATVSYDLPAAVKISIILNKGRLIESPHDFTLPAGIVRIELVLCEDATGGFYRVHIYAWYATIEWLLIQYWQFGSEDAATALRADIIDAIKLSNCPQANPNDTSRSWLSKPER